MDEAGTFVINDHAQPSSNDGNKQPGQSANWDSAGDRQGQHYQAIPDLRPDFALFGSAGLPGFGNGGGFLGVGSSGAFYQPQPAQSMSFLDNLSGSLRRHNQRFEHQFRDLERQAGEGQDVSYFNQNGVAYMRTCTTKRVSHGHESGQNKQPDQILPLGQEYQSEQQQQKQQQRSAGASSSSSSQIPSSLSARQPTQTS
jgi:hypothetical protein